MEKNMFCYQCQETANGIGCKLIGVCGKKPEVAKAQDLLIYLLKAQVPVCLFLNPAPLWVRRPK